MKKVYIQPSTKYIALTAESLIATSGGVKTGSGVGNEYNSEDDSYSRQQGSPIWDTWSN